MVVRIGGEQLYLWRAVSAAGEVLEVLEQMGWTAPNGISVPQYGS
jgi:hypothetical protein